MANDSPPTKSQILSNIAEAAELSRKQVMRRKIFIPSWLNPLIKNSVICFIIYIILFVLIWAFIAAYDDVVYGPDNYYNVPTIHEAYRRSLMLAYVIFGGYGICLIATSIFMAIRYYTGEEQKATRRHKRYIKAKTDDELVHIWLHQIGYKPEIIIGVKAEIEKRHIDIRSRIDNLIAKYEGVLEFHIAFLSVWMAMSKGRVANDEYGFIRNLSRINLTPPDIDLIVECLKGDSGPYIQRSCRIIQLVGPEQKGKLMELFILVALRDGLITTPELHILRLFSDILGIQDIQLNQLFRKISVEEIPFPSDLSSIEWWQQRERNRQAKRERRAKQSTGYREYHTVYEPKIATARNQALAILGLEEDATVDDIKKSYRRLVKIHHPDKYHKLGTRAVEMATNTFKQINEAYEHLRPE